MMPSAVVAPTEQTRQAAARRGLVLISLAAAAATVIMAVLPDAQIGITSIPLRVALEVLGVCALLCAALVLSLFGSPETSATRDPLVAALIVIALANAVFGVLPFITGQRIAIDHGLALYPWAAARWLAGLLFVCAAIEWPRIGLRLTVGWALLGLVSLEIGLLAIGSRLTPPVVYSVGLTPVIVSPFEHLVVQVVPGGLFAIGAWQAARLYRQSGGQIVLWLAFALAVQAFAQLHELLFPAMLGPRVTSADALRSMAFAALFVGAIMQVRAVDAAKSRTVRLQAHDLRDQQQLVEALRQFAEDEAHFRSIVTHELSTPLAAIRSYTDVVHRLAQPQNDQLDAALATMRTETTRLLALVQRIDELRDVETLTFSCELRPVRIIPLLDEAMHFVLSLDSVHPVTIDCPDVRVMADPVRIGQVVRNLMHNAAKFSPFDAEIRITGRVEGDTLNVSVLDRGPGIPEHERPLALRRYGRGANALGTNGQGLGLYIAAQIAEQHGNPLTIEGGELGGACITFTLELA